MSFNGQALRELRRKAGLTREELAAKVEEISDTATTSTAAIGYWETGEWSPGGSCAAALAEIFGVPLVRLFMVPDSLPIPRQLISDLIEGLRHDDSRWCLGLLQGALSSLGFRVAFTDAEPSVILDALKKAAEAAQPVEVEADGSDD